MASTTKPIVEMFRFLIIFIPSAMNHECQDQDYKPPNQISRSGRHTNKSLVGHQVAADSRPTASCLARGHRRHRPIGIEFSHPVENSTDGIEIDEVSETLTIQNDLESDEVSAIAPA